MKPSMLLRSFAILLLAPALAACQSEAEGVGLKELGEKTHFHGIGFDPNNPERLYLATHHGLHIIGDDGLARQISQETHDFMGFAPHPGDPELFFASGHPQRGGNLGFIVSSDGGKTWEQRAPGAGGPVDFHQLTVSKADPQVLYGAYHGRLQVSRDGGHDWEIQGPAPEGLIGLTASSRNSDHLYAATQTGLLMSPDGGKRWRQAHPERRPTSVVTATAGGDLYAFMPGLGLLRTTEETHDWQVLSDDWGEDYLLHLAIDPNNGERLVGVDQRSRVLMSENGGRDWKAL
ncbi:WD40/YVTN/BNR-like repeat-containing protein [Litchfieldella rifensis]|uniref:WD40/YVTN/BNR-like repeat-containing protein n=1 Tax=Litchfieldella rifensis TaxID=762643 RepID=A0ABV7LS96_9GAMM